MKRYSTAFTWIAALATVAVVLVAYEGNLLWKLQEMNLFLCSTEFFKQQMLVAGGLLTWMGTFFTQFLYHPLVGVLMLCAWWMLLMWLTKSAFCIPRRWAVVALIPVALILLTIVDMGYWVYVLKLRGHVFVATLGTTAAVALLWAYRSLPGKLLRPLFIVVASLIGYPLLGIYGLAATLLMGILSWRMEPKGRAVAYTAVAVLMTIAVPLICYRYVYYQTNLANIYWAELPLYFITEDYHQYYIPFYLLLLFYVVMAVIYRPWSQETQGAGGLLRRYWAQATLLVVTVAGVAFFWFKDENFHHELAMEHSIDRLDWESVLEEARTQSDEPTRAIVMMRNLALARQGRQGSEMFLYLNGSKRYNFPFSMRLMQVIGPLIYYHYAVLNYSIRLSTEMGVEYGWRKEYYKNLVRCALITGEHQVARKYIGILKQSLFTGEFTAWAENLLKHPDQIAHDEETGFVTHMRHQGNVIGSDQGYVERFLMNQLSLNPYTGDPIFQEQALLATFWTKNVASFWERFYAYIRLHPTDPMPRYYQEAAYLYGRQENRQNLDRLPFDQMVKDNYERFMKIAPRYEGTDFDEARDALYPLFGQTYYYEFFLMRQLPEY